MGRKTGKIIFVFLLFVCFLLVKSNVQTLAKDKQKDLYFADFSNNLQPAIQNSVTLFANQEGNSGTKVGAGVIWKTEGEICYILTCAHIFKNLDVPKILITPFEKTENSNYFEGELVGLSEKYDIALLQTTSLLQSGSALSPAKNIAIGMPIFAFGNPEGLGESVSAGILSIPNEEIGDKTFHRINCTLLPGNSGGGLFDNQGNIIGIVTSKILTSNALDGYGYAIPYAIAEKVAMRILEEKAEFSL